MIKITDKNISHFYFLLADMNGTDIMHGKHYIRAFLKLSLFQYFYRPYKSNRVSCYLLFDSQYKYMAHMINTSKQDPNLFYCLSAE